MQGTGVSFEDVVIAANHLQAQGQNPTIEKIRLHLGSGSNTTINKYLKMWRAQQQVIQEGVGSSDWTSDVVKMAAEQAWASIRKEAENKINSIKQEADDAIQLAEQQVLEAQQHKANAEQASAQIGEQLLSLQATYELQVLDFKTLQHEHAILLERSKGLERHLDTNERLYEQRFRELSLHHDAELARLAELRQEGQIKLEHHIDDLKNQYESMRHQAMLDLNQSQEQNKKLVKELDGMREQLHHREQQISELKTLITTYAQQREDNLKLTTSFATQLTNLTSSIEAQKFTQANSLETLGVQLSTTAAELQQTLETILSKLAKFKHKKKIVKIQDETKVCA